MKHSRKKKIKSISAEKFDALHDAGGDISQYMDWSSARRPGMEIHRVNVDFPQWMIDKLDREAKRLGVSRQAVIKVWIGDRLEEGEQKKTA